ncbi:hypothetical protein B5M44_21935 [Shinella sumterensis]|nr:hypothetical protein B5M44_21935 [Shinella sumterensis]
MGRISIEMNPEGMKMKQARIHQISDHLWSQGKVARFDTAGNITYTFYRQSDKRVMRAGTVSEYFSDGDGHVWRVRADAA